MFPYFFFLGNHLSLQPYKKSNQILSSKSIITHVRKQMEWEGGEARRKEGRGNHGQDIK